MTTPTRCVVCGLTPKVCDGVIPGPDRWLAACACSGRNGPTVFAAARKWENWHNGVIRRAGKVIEERKAKA
jgi:hypothetical protein